MYEVGKGVSANKRKAIERVMLSAEQGYPAAQHYIGVSYYAGDGVDKNKKIAAMWYLKAAEQGYSDSQINLGNMYAEGMGVSYDLIHSFIWLNAAVIKENHVAVNNLKLISKRMTETQLKSTHDLPVNVSVRNAKGVE